MMKIIQSRSVLYLRSSLWGSTYLVNRIQNVPLLNFITLMIQKNYQYTIFLHSTLADAAYGLAKISGKREFCQAKSCAETCNSIREEIGSTKLEELELLLGYVNQKLNTPRLNNFFDKMRFHTRCELCSCSESNSPESEVSEESVYWP